MMTELCRLSTGNCVPLQFNWECVNTFLTNTPAYKVSWNLPPGSHSVACRWTNIVNFIVSVAIVFWKCLYKFLELVMIEFRFSDHFAAGMTIFTTGSQFVTSLHHPYWCMIQCPCMDVTVFKFSHFSLDVFSKTQTFSSHVFYTFRCHTIPYHTVYFPSVDLYRITNSIWIWK